MPGKEPGEVFIPALGRSFKQIELREDDTLDTVQQGSGSISAGTELVMFRDLADKNEQHTSLKASRRLPSGDEMAVFRIGWHPRGANGNDLLAVADARKLSENFVLVCKFNRRLVSEGPVIKYQSGYGLVVYGVETGAGSHSNGVPSAAAAPTLFVPQQLKDDDDINVTLRSPGAAWITSYTAPSLAGRVLQTVFLHGIIKSPLGK
jgi:hypothetical protein